MFGKGHHMCYAIDGRKFTHSLNVEWSIYLDHLFRAQLLEEIGNQSHPKALL